MSPPQRVFRHGEAFAFESLAVGGTSSPIIDTSDVAPYPIVNRPILISQIFVDAGGNEDGEAWSWILYDTLLAVVPFGSGSSPRVLRYGSTSPIWNNIPPPQRSYERVMQYVPLAMGAATLDQQGLRFLQAPLLVVAPKATATTGSSILSMSFRFTYL